MESITRHLYRLVGTVLSLGALTPGCDGGSEVGYLGPATSGVYTVCDRLDYCFEEPEKRLNCDHGDGTSENCVPWPGGCGEILTCKCAGALLCGDRTCVERVSREEIFCVVDAAPSCGEYLLGDKWDTEDGCNRCSCKVYGVHCGGSPCPSEDCAEFVSNYEALVAGAKACEVGTECQRLTINCLMGNRCLEYVNMSLSTEPLDELDKAWTDAECDVPGIYPCCESTFPPPEAVCVDGQCAPKPPDSGPCGKGISVGAVGQIVGCNLCDCTETGFDCTDHKCPETCAEVKTLWQSVLPSVQQCPANGGCLDIFGPAWISGLSDCWVPVAGDYNRAWFNIVEEQWFNLGCHGSPASCTPDAEAECVEGACVLVQ